MRKLNKFYFIFSFLLLSCNFTDSSIKRSNVGVDPLNPSEPSTTTTTSTTTTQPEIIPIDRTQGDSTSGANLYITEGCLSCHGADGSGGAYDISIVQSSDKEIYLSITKGGDDMPIIPLSDSEIQDIASFIGNNFTP